MNEKVAGQVRHLLSGLGGLATGTGAVAESPEAVVGGAVLWLVGQAWSWLAKRHDARAR